MQFNFKYSKEKSWLEDDNGNQIAILEHPEIHPDLVNLVHTEVDPAMNGQGLAGKLTQAVAEKLRDEKIKAELTCSYSINWFAKHPEYNDVLADSEKI